MRVIGLLEIEVPVREIVARVSMIDPVEVTELRPGLWRWTTDHPDWEPDEGLSRRVGSVYFEAPGAVTLVDPLVPEDEDENRFWKALDRDVERLERPVVVVPTVPWHERAEGP